MTAALLGATRADLLAGAGDATIADWSDAQLVDAAGAVLSAPKRDAADSFVLHSGLELLARTALLRFVAPQARVGARRQLLALAAEYHQAGPGCAPAPADAVVFDSPEAALVRLGAAIDSGELDDVDGPAAWLAASLDPMELARGVAPLTIGRLGAAGHGPIWSFLLSRVAPAQRAVAGTLRPLVRELAREHTWHLSWFRGLGPGGSATDSSLFDRLAWVDFAETPESTFIIPTMDLVERSGLAASLLAEPVAVVSLAEARRDLGRVAALSMVQDDPDHAPYGWSHCLTMAQAALGVADWVEGPREAIAVAATFSLGFRATLGRTRLDPGWHPSSDRNGGVASIDSLDGSPTEAAAAAWHAATGAARSQVIATLASYASGHDDAHLAKYTLACFDQAAADPAALPLFLAIAAYLGAWWKMQEG